MSPLPQKSIDFLKFVIFDVFSSPTKLDVLSFELGLVLTTMVFFYILSWGKTALLPFRWFSEMRHRYDLMRFNRPIKLQKGEISAQEKRG